MYDKSILLVEDNADDEKLAMKALTQDNISCQVSVVRDGQEALDYLFYEGKFINRPRTTPHVILLDLKLPKIDGVEVLRRIRAAEATKFIPVVILTSSQLEKDIADSYAGGANSYLVKPINSKQFLESMRQFINYWLDLNKNWE